MRYSRQILTSASLLFTATLAAACGQPAPADESGTAAAEPAAAQAPQDAAEKVEFLLVQTAQGVRYADGKLTLEAVHPMTLYFSDRPERVTGWLPTSDQITHWATGDDSFASDPPNADLSILTANEDLQITVELTNPKLADGNLTYDVKVLEGEMPAAAGATALFIDVVGMPATPVSVAGADRRFRRRVVY